MNTQKHEIRSELKAISRYRGLLLSRILLCLLFLIIAKPFGFLPIYLAAALVFFPPVIVYLIHSAKTSVSSSEKSNLLPETMKKYQFTYEKYYAEIVTFFLSLIFFIVWQATQAATNWHSIPLRHIPTLLFVLYFVTIQMITVFYRVYIHYQFTHLIIKD